MKSTKLVLESGNEFIGKSPDWCESDIFGEVVFTTGMVGYPETLTDPSYAGQIITFTYPLIGNYGIPNRSFWESTKIHACGVVISQECVQWSHQSGQLSLLEWLKEQNVPIIVGVDTRELTKTLRESGTLLGGITAIDSTDHSFVDPHRSPIVPKVTATQTTITGSGAKKIIAVDCGMKENIIRSLSKFPLTVKRVPFDYDYTDEDFDGVFISNGPGNPQQCPETVHILAKAMKQKKPIFGICLGAQLMALAAGAKTYKLLYGHRGHNQPCLEISSDRCYITSQNHGYAIDGDTLPDDWTVTFRNLNDGSVEGIAHKEHPYFSVQFHPEAAPGPTDTAWLFERFYELLS